MADGAATSAPRRGTLRTLYFFPLINGRGDLKLPLVGRCRVPYIGFVGYLEEHSFAGRRRYPFMWFR